MTKAQRNREVKLEAMAPNCPVCKRYRGKDEQMRIARNYGRATERWWCSLCGHLENMKVD